MKKETNAKKKRRQRGKKERKPFNRKVLLLGIVVAGLFFASVKGIVSLKMEHYRLSKQNESLKEERRRLKIELKNVNSKEYIEEQARKQLRLIDPDEILFVFPEEEKKEENASGGE